MYLFLAIMFLFERRGSLTQNGGNVSFLFRKLLLCFFWGGGGHRVANYQLVG